MIQSKTKGSCGSCGNDVFKLYTNDETKNIMVQCQGCQELSHIVIKSLTYMDIVPDDSSIGMLDFPDEG
jgi:hypothetical protein